MSDTNAGLPPLDVTPEDTNVGIAYGIRLGKEIEDDFSPQQKQWSAETMIGNEHASRLSRERQLADALRRLAEVERERDEAHKSCELLRDDLISQQEVLLERAERAESKLAVTTGTLQAIANARPLRTGDFHLVAAALQQMAREALAKADATLAPDKDAQPQENHLA